MQKPFSRVGRGSCISENSNFQKCWNRAAQQLRPAFAVATGACARATGPLRPVRLYASTDVDLGDRAVRSG